MLTKLNPIFLERLKEIYNREEYEEILASFLLEKRKTSFRINTLQGNKEEVEAELIKNAIDFHHLDFLENCYVIETGKERDLWNLECYKQGKIYIQWISSQIPVHFLELKEWQKIADIAAAPWGKTSQISEYLKNTGEVVATEIHKIRSEKLNYNMKKLSCENVQVFNIDAKKLIEQFEESYFDAILFDAPCSGEWSINIHNEKSFAEWSEIHIKRNYQRQKEIIDKTLPLLKSWWIFIYCTCTLAPEENEAIVHYILCNHKDLEIQDLEIPLKNTKAWIKKFKKYIYTSWVEKSQRILPNTEMEGFFIAKFRKI